jgi:hypothetical protein
VPGAPRDFDWRAYLLRYADLRASGIRTREAAAAHYVANGRRESRGYSRVPILLRYTACQGLFNQVRAPPGAGAASRDSRAQQRGARGSSGAAAAPPPPRGRGRWGRAVPTPGPGGRSGTARTGPAGPL